MNLRIILGRLQKVNSFKIIYREYKREFKNLIEEGPKRQACVKDQLLGLFSFWRSCLYL